LKWFQNQTRSDHKNLTIKCVNSLTQMFHLYSRSYYQ